MRCNAVLFSKPSEKSRLLLVCFFFFWLQQVRERHTWATER
jgi:hypothetical protein